MGVGPSYWRRQGLGCTVFQLHAVPPNAWKRNFTRSSARQHANHYLPGCHLQLLFQHLEGQGRVSMGSLCRAPPLQRPPVVCKLQHAAQAFSNPQGQAMFGNDCSVISVHAACQVAGTGAGGGWYADDAMICRTSKICRGEFLALSGVISSIS